MTVAMLQTSKASGKLLMVWVAALAASCSPAAELASAAGPLVARPVTALSYRQVIWTTEQGLPNNTIQVLLQSRDGYLWIGTAGGLVRFDGQRFTVFQRRSHPAMVNDDCRALAQATDGSLWIGTANGLLRYSGGVFQRFTQEHGLGDPTVRSLVASRHNEIWIATTKGLTRWRHGTFSRYLAPDKSNNFDDQEALSSESCPCSARFCVQ
jgi:ligand-binding sensor domain-containing protein